MEIKDFNEFQETLGLMAGILQRQMPSDKTAWDREVNCYFKILCDDFSIETFRECANYILKHNQFYPKPCEFYSTLETLEEQKYEAHQREMRQEQLKRQAEEKRKWDALPEEEKKRINAERQRMADLMLSHITSLSGRSR